MNSPHRKCAFCGAAFLATAPRQTYCTPAHARQGEVVRAKTRRERYARNLLAMGRGPGKRELRGRGYGLAHKEDGATRAARLSAQHHEIMNYDLTPVEGEMACAPIIDTEAEAAALADAERRIAEYERAAKGLRDPWE